MGNQLFQYAFGRAVALRSGCTLNLDTSLFERDTTYRRTYELAGFRIPVHVTVRTNGGLPVHFRRRLSAIVDRWRCPERRAVVAERRPLKYYVDYARLKIARPVTLYGYWQCPRYFADIAAQLRDDLRFSNVTCAHGQKLVEEVHAGNSVAVHIRQAQFVKKLDGGYYSKAIVRMREEHPSAHFYVFGDVPGWFEEQGKYGSDVTVVRSNGLPAIEDFKLMCMCKHFIIANSTFSWWAAWLGSLPEKRVIAPDQQAWDNPDVIDHSWTRICLG